MMPIARSSRVRECGSDVATVRTSCGVRSRGSVEGEGDVGLWRRMYRSMPAVSRYGRSGCMSAVFTIESCPTTRMLDKKQRERKRRASTCEASVWHRELGWDITGAEVRLSIS